jgi:hypothetical protein
MKSVTKEIMHDILDVLKKLSWLLNNHEDRLKQLEKRMTYLERHEDDDGR